ncbi:MAG: hypothetical protein GX664_05360 [Bacteroidales bacterium]|nr:hypothetical protein [Bacteroidales bacterium]
MRNAIYCPGLIFPVGGNEMTITAYSSGILSYKGGTPASGQKVANG